MHRKTQVVRRFGNAAHNIPGIPDTLPALIMVLWCLQLQLLYSLLPGTWYIISRYSRRLDALRVESSAVQLRAIHRMLLIGC